MQTNNFVKPKIHFNKTSAFLEAQFQYSVLNCKFEVYPNDKMFNAAYSSVIIYCHVNRGL